mmetsp:Transcript_13676/g.32966  ORF Transcript_13676/g.32966 Transcript_13676/m.32966 type:complete len:200 (-) Transcript_13676:33-632(-)
MHALDIPATTPATYHSPLQLYSLLGKHNLRAKTLWSSERLLPELGNSQLRVKLVRLEAKLGVARHRVRVVAQHLQRQLAAPPARRHLRHPTHHRLRHSLPPVLGLHKDVVHVDQRFTLKRAEPLEAVHQPHRFAADGGHHAERARYPPQLDAQPRAHVIVQRAGVAELVQGVAVEQVGHRLRLVGVGVVRYICLDGGHN